MKRITTIFLMFLASLLLSTVAWCEDTGTVIRVKGNAEIKTKSSSDWKPLNNGDKVQIGDTIKTGVRSLVRLMNPDGSLTRIRANKTKIYKGASKKMARAKRGWKDSLGELVGERKRKRIAATRGGDKDPNQHLWMETMKNELIGDDIERVMELASTYKEKKSNRSVALLWKLQAAFPEHNGFSQLAENAAQDYKNDVKWKVIKKNRSGKSSLRSGETLYEGNGLQIQYYSEGESYHYFFFTTQPLRGEIQTFPVFPSALDAVSEDGSSRYFEARIPPKEKAYLPGRGQYFTLDAAKGNEHLWAWSCPGPVMDQQLIKRAIENIRSALLQKPSLTEDVVNQSAPSVCRSVLALSVKHR